MLSSMLRTLTSGWCGSQSAPCVGGAQHRRAVLGNDAVGGRPSLWAWHGHSFAVRRLPEAGLPDPRLGADLDRLPGTAEGRRVGKVEVADVLDGHAREDCRRGDVDALGHLGMAVPEKLHAEKPAAAAVTGEPHRDAVAARVV